MNTFKMLNNEDLGALASPFRRQLLVELAEKSDSAANIARRHDMSRQRVGYHMRDLEKAGYIEMVEERQQRGLKERLYRMRSVAYVQSAPQKRVGDIQDRYSWSHLINALAQGLSDLMTIRKQADITGKKVATLGIEAQVTFENARARQEFTEELASEFARLIKKYHQPASERGRSFKFLLGGFPLIQHRSDNNESYERH